MGGQFSQSFDCPETPSPNRWPNWAFSTRYKMRRKDPMKRIYFACLFLFLTTFLLAQSNPVPPINRPADPKAQAKVLDTYGKLPLSFEANYGQTDKRVQFL